MQCACEQLDMFCAQCAVASITYSLRLEIIYVFVNISLNGKKKKIICQEAYNTPFCFLSLIWFIKGVSS